MMSNFWQKPWRRGVEEIFYAIVVVMHADIEIVKGVDIEDVGGVAISGVGVGNTAAAGAGRFVHQIFSARVEIGAIADHRNTVLDIGTMLSVDLPIVDFDNIVPAVVVVLAFALSEHLVPRYFAFLAHRS